MRATALSDPGLVHVWIMQTFPGDKEFELVKQVGSFIVLYCPEIRSEWPKTEYRVAQAREIAKFLADVESFKEVLVLLHKRDEMWVDQALHFAAELRNALPKRRRIPVRLLALAHTEDVVRQRLAALTRQRVSLTSAAPFSGPFTLDVLEVAHA